LLRSRSGRAVFIGSELAIENLRSWDFRFDSIFGASYFSPAPSTTNFRSRAPSSDIDGVPTDCSCTSHKPRLLSRDRFLRPLLRPLSQLRRFCVFISVAREIILNSAKRQQMASFLKNRRISQNVLHSYAFPSGKQGFDLADHPSSRRFREPFSLSGRQ